MHVLSRYAHNTSICASGLVTVHVHCAWMCIAWCESEFIEWRTFVSAVLIYRVKEHWKMNDEWLFIYSRVHLLARLHMDAIATK